MPSITGFTSARTQEIEDAIIVGASIVGGHLILERNDGAEIDAGDVRGGEQIPHSSSTQVTAATPVGTTLSTFNNLQVPLSVSGFVKHRADTKLICEYAGSIVNDDALGQYEVAINLGGVNRVIANGFSTGGQKSGILTITGIAAGTYTINVHYRRVNSTGTVLDGYLGARNALKVTETF